MFSFKCDVYLLSSSLSQIQIIREVNVWLSQVFAVITGDEKHAIFLAYIYFTVFTQNKKTLRMKVFSSTLILLRSIKAATDNCKLLKIHQSAMLNSSKPIKVAQPFRAARQIPFKLHIEFISSVSSSNKCSQFNFLFHFSFFFQNTRLLINRILLNRILK